MLARYIVTSDSFHFSLARVRLHARGMLDVTAASQPACWPAGKRRIFLGSASYSRQGVHGHVRHNTAMTDALPSLPCAGIMKELAQEYGFEYETVTADIDEQALGDRTSNPAELVKLLSKAKADAIFEWLKHEHVAGVQGLLLTCDQVVVHQGKIREKPISTEQVVAMYHMFQCKIAWHA